MHTSRIMLLPIVLLASSLAACGGDDRFARPKDPGPAYEDTPVVILPDLVVPHDPGVRPDSGGHLDAAEDAAADHGNGADTVATDSTADTALDPGTTKPDACIPQCAGRDCGPDGCKGLCGMCEQADICIDGTCVCIPDCAEKDKKCGDDGCGGSCGTCPDGLSCDEESFMCATTGPCPNSSVMDPSLGCDAPWSSRTGQKPAGNDVVFYGGPCQRYAIGTEKAYKFTAPESGQVTLTLKGSGGAGAMPEALDAYVLSGSTCDGSNCIAWGHDTVQFEAVSGESYWLLIDATASVDESFWMGFDASWCEAAAQ